MLIILALFFYLRRNMTVIGKNIKKIRTLKGMNQTAFGKLFDITRASIGAYEEGRAEPKMNTTIQIANYFSISLDSLLTKEISVNELSGFNPTDFQVQSKKQQQSTIPIIDKAELSKFQSQLNTNTYVPEHTCTFPAGFDFGDIIFEFNSVIQTDNSFEITDGDMLACSVLEGNKSLSNSYLVISKKDIKIVEDYKVEENNPAVQVYVINQIITKNFSKAKNNTSIENKLDALEARLNKIEGK